jgi:hypothetical protein
MLAIATEVDDVGSGKPVLLGPGLGMLELNEEEPNVTGTRLVSIEVDPSATVCWPVSSVSVLSAELPLIVGKAMLV